jgi:hypothetical protein
MLAAGPFIMLSGYNQSVQYVNLYKSYAAFNNHRVINGAGIEGHRPDPPGHLG